MNWILYFKIHTIDTVVALLILFSGIFLAKLMKKLLVKKIEMKSKDPTAKIFVIQAIYVLVIVVVGISALARLGVPTASLLTVLGATSLTIGLALKNSLSHVASGLILVALKPFHIGDTVEINGVTGTVKQLSLFNISIKTANGDCIVIPNSKVFSDKIRTKGVDGRRRIDLAIGISYDSDIKKAKSIIKNLLDNNELVLAEPEARVIVKELSESSVQLAVRPWVKKNEYSDVLFDLTEQIKILLDENNITIPYPTIEARINCSSPSSIENKV